MAYALEKIDPVESGKLKTELRKYQAVPGIVDSRYVDRDNDIVFYSLGGQGGSPDPEATPDCYLMFWKGSPVRFDSRSSSYKVPDGYGLAYSLDNFFIPETLQASTEAVKEEIHLLFELLNQARQFPLKEISLKFPKPTYFGNQK